MAREIRITIDDDEVFERMKARKRELDLSWEDVLHRGLRRERAPEGDVAARHGAGGHPADPLDSPGTFAEDLKRQIQNQVRQSVSASLDPTPDDESYRDPLDADVSTLEQAEDGVLVFDFLGDDASDSAAQVPIRVTLEASAAGLDADVVTVRQGRSVSSMNSFAPEIRRRVVEGLATGERATLRLGGGAETYRVSPRLTWSRADGRPTVADVTIDEVEFDAD